jgi:hypothetical protein
MLKRLFTIKTKAGHISSRMVQYKQINKFNMSYQQNEAEKYFQQIHKILFIKLYTFLVITVVNCV